MRRAALLLALLWAIPVRAGAVRATASIEPDPVPAGGTAALRIDIDANVHLAGSPSFPVANLEIVSGPALESSFQWINGHSSSRTSLTYQVRAIAPGAASAGPFRLAEEGGGTIEAPAVNATVVRGEAGGLPPGGPAGDPMLVERLEPPSPQAGAQAVWTLYLATRGEAVRAEVRQLPAFRGFWAEPLEEEASVPPSLWRIGGAAWRAYPLARRALFPSKAGDLAIGPSRAVAIIRSNALDAFALFPLTDTRPVDLVSPPLSVRVRPLPGSAGDLPVGSFTLRAAVATVQTTAGEPVTLTATLSGDGRLAGADAPALTLAGASVSDPESRLSIRRGGPRLVSTRTWQWLVTPERPGTLLIPALRFAVFDPAAGARRVLTTSPISLAVAGAPAVPPPAALPEPAPRAARAGTSRLLLALLAAAGLALAAAAFALGRRSARGAPADSGGEPAERRLERLLGALASASAAEPRAAQEVAELRRRLDALLYAPQLGDRGDAAREIERRAARLARRLRVRQ